MFTVSFDGHNPHSNMRSSSLSIGMDYLWRFLTMTFPVVNIRDNAPLLKIVTIIASVMSS